MAIKYRDPKSGRILSQKTVENWKPIKKITGTKIVKEGKRYRPENPSEVEDRIMKEFKEHEFLLFPEEAANMDKRSLDALEASYNYDMSKNSEILGDISFRDYLDKVNPELLRQRSLSERGLEENYLGPGSDASNGVSDLARPLKSAAEQFGDNYNKVVNSAKRAHSALSNLETNLEEKLAKTNQDKRSQMFGEGLNIKDRNPSV